ncbi:MAG: hypothetical protein HC884_18195 [Chloroflexaceae bacterium]|nr:hypothetical protein [Chloroflexaceae bacterium]
MNMNMPYRPAHTGPLETRMRTNAKTTTSPSNLTSVTDHPPRQLIIAAYVGTAFLAALALYLVMNSVINWGRITLDDLRYGRPRTMHLEGFVGHEAGSGTPTRFLAMNLSRQVVVLEVPGGDPASVRSFAGPYLFGAGEDLTPVVIALRDMDRDNFPDLLINVRNETIVYLNKEGTFRLPTPEEQAGMLREQ